MDKLYLFLLCCFLGSISELFKRMHEPETNDTEGAKNKKATLWQIDMAKDVKAAMKAILKEYDYLQEFRIDDRDFGCAYEIGLSCKTRSGRQKVLKIGLRYPNTFVGASPDAKGQFEAVLEEKGWLEFLTELEPLLVDLVCSHYSKPEKLRELYRLGKPAV